MTNDEILVIKKRRDRLKITIRELVAKQKNAYDKVVKFNEWTDLLIKEGYKLSIKADILKLESWEEGGKYYEYRQQPTPIKNTTKVNSTPSTKIQTESISEEEKTKKYILCLAWTDNKGDGESKQVKEIKSLINTLYMKLVDTEEVANGDRVDHILKYEFVGTHDAFSLLKQVLQWVADSFALSEMDKFNVAVYGKKKR